MDDLPFQPRDSEGPVFKEPWEAQAFSLVIALHERGLFSWQEWAAVLSQEILAAQQRGDPDIGNSYYQHWLKALEKISELKGLAKFSEMKDRKQQWRSAYANTAHGMPIRLAKRENS